MAKKGRRRNFKASEKVAILKRHLVEREEVSAICSLKSRSQSQIFPFMTVSKE